MKKNLQQIKLIIMDVDGVLTDGRIILGKNEELKFFNVHDGMGITLAKKSGMKIGIITSRTSKAVERRAEELEMDYIIQGNKNKLESLNKILKVDCIIVGDEIWWKDCEWIGDEKRLEKFGNFNVLMTRAKDISLSLNERVEIANASRADLFISIHLNSLPSLQNNFIET